MVDTGYLDTWIPFAEGVVFILVTQPHGQPGVVAAV